MCTLEQEVMRVLLLDTKNHVLAIATVYTGSVNTTVIRVAELFKAAIRQNCTALIVLLLFFSGEVRWLHYTGRVTDNQASQRQAFPDNILHISIEDVAVTTEIVKAGKILDIDVLDRAP
jgi:DNA repair protein RadC